jgi:hypothetical protein
VHAATAITATTQAIRIAVAIATDAPRRSIEIC